MVKLTILYDGSHIGFRFNRSPAKPLIWNGRGNPLKIMIKFSYKNRWKEGVYIYWIVFSIFTSKNRVDKEGFVFRIFIGLFGFEFNIRIGKVIHS